MNGSVVTSPAGGAGHQPLAMLREYLDRLRVNNKQLPRRNGRPNKLAIAKRCGNEDQSQTRERMVFRKAGLNLLELGEALRGRLVFRARDLPLLSCDRKLFALACREGVGGTARAPGQGVANI
jgi:hypothetical protein